MTMDHIDISADQVVPLEDIAPGLIGLRIAFVNVFAVSHPNGTWVLIDAGIPGSATRIRSWAERHFSTPPAAIVLTHGHFDHVGAALTLAEEWNIPVYAHPLEFPFLDGTQSYPPPNQGAGGGLMSLLSPLYPKDPINLGNHLRPLPEGSESGIAALEGWEILHTPGHTPGHVSFFRERDRTLLVGDAFCSTKPEAFFEAAILQEPELHGPPAYFTSDWQAARASVMKLAALHPGTVALGHGKPLSGAALPSELQQLASRFDEVAVPENRKAAVAP